jgi:hypothetical protein
MVLEDDDEDAGRFARAYDSCRKTLKTNNERVLTECAKSTLFLEALRRLEKL